ncbi:MAG: hypothetical protein HY909_08565 [Deltaproteobacteria bacterium]|nr:hypothetical protein [Deltaproteobacteria bacterium]
MTKPQDYYVGALDLFGALLPGLVTLGAALALNIPSGLPEALRARLPESEEARALMFVLLGYVLGQVANGLGSVFLDVLYDLLYEPGTGLLSLREKHRPRRLLARLALSFCDFGVDDRRDALLTSLTALLGQRPTAVYKTVRAYLKVKMPEAFYEVEKHEGEQKFFRALVVGFLALAAARHWGPPPTVAARVTAAQLLLGAAVLFVRYVSLRRKTVEGAYFYFSVRDLGAGPAPKAHPEASHDAGH